MRDNRYVSYEEALDKIIALNGNGTEPMTPERIGYSKAINDVRACLAQCKKRELPPIEIPISWNIIRE